MKVSIKITGSNENYTAKVSTSEPLNSETRTVLHAAVGSLLSSSAEAENTSESLFYMKQKREQMKKRSADAKNRVDKLSDGVPVWVKWTHPVSGGEAEIGARAIKTAKKLAKRRAKKEALEKKIQAESGTDDIPF